MDRYQYLLVMAACLVLTLPLEVVLGARVYRHPLRLLATLAVVAVPFLLWDLIAIRRHHWDFSPRYTTGWSVPGRVPLEEVSFFVVIPICALLTHGAVRRMRERRRA
jgi:lycopene cyclase domain-containing protein